MYEFCDFTLDVAVKKAVTRRQFQAIDEFAHTTCLSLVPQNKGD